ncbi:MAG: glycosyltransferase [bacterium]
MRINVLHVVCISDFYGTQRSVLATVRSLDRDVFQCRVAAPFGEIFFGKLAGEGVPVHVVPMRGLWDLSSAVEIAGIIRREKIDVVHCHLGISTFLGLMGAALAGCGRRVVTRHFIRDRYTGVHPAAYPFYLWIYRLMNRRFDVTICVSGAVMREVVRREKIQDERCVVIPNGVRVEPPPAAGQGTRAEVRRELGVPGEGVMVLTLSRLAREKGLDVLLRAAAECVRKRGDLYFVVAGGGDMESELKGFSEKSGLEGRVIFPGYREDVERLLCAADVYVLPSLEEPMGISVLEAMSAGVPVVAADSGGPKEIIEDGVTGFLVPPGDHAALSGKVTALVENDALRKTFSENALGRVRDFDEKKIAERIGSIYITLVEGARKE